MQDVSLILEKVYLHHKENEFTSYEDLPKFALGYDASVEQYYEALRNACHEINEMRQLVMQIQQVAAQNKRGELVDAQSLSEDDLYVNQVLDSVLVATDKINELLECDLFNKLMDQK
jgi:hypothetical protein